MKYLTKLSIVIISFLFPCCIYNNKNNFKIIVTEKVSPIYSYNPDGVIKNKYGNLNIKTISYYNQQGHLIKLLWNRPNGYLEYTLSELREDPFLLSSFQIDTIFSTKTYINYEVEEKNDSIFYLSNKEIIIRTNN